jgi:predicted phage-related endonuclease
MSTPTLRRVTPAGFLLMSAAAIARDRDTWLAARRNVIGGSDAPRICNVYPSPLRVWYDKRGELPPGDDEGTDDRAVRMRMGRRFEPAVADEWTMRNRTVTRNFGMVGNIERPWLACTLDRRVAQCPLPADAPSPTAGGRNVCALEVKLTTVFLAPRWRRQVPDGVLAQVMHSMRVTGDDHQHVAVNIGGTDGFRHMTVYRDGPDRPVYDYVAEVVDEFHERYIAGGEKPASSDDAELWDEVYPDRAGVLTIDDPEAVIAALELRERYDALGEQVSGLKKEREAAKGALLALAAGAELVKVNDDLLFSYLERPGRSRVDEEGLVAAHPDVYAAYVTPTTHRTMNTGARARRGKRS